MKKKEPAKQVTDKAKKEELLKKVKASLSKPSKPAVKKKETKKAAPGEKDFTQKSQSPDGEKTCKG